MIHKLFGVCLLICGCSGLGFYYAGKWREHLELLTGLRKSFYFMKGQISYARASIAEALEETAKRSDRRIAPFFFKTAARTRAMEGMPLAVIWSEEADRQFVKSALSKDDLDQLKGAGTQLGLLDVEMQERTILLYMEQLDAAVLYQREHLRERNRLYLGMGIMSGLFLAIILY